MRIIRIPQCYFCPYMLFGNSTAVNDVGFCKMENKSLNKTMVKIKGNTYTQTIPEWCPLEMDDKGA